MFEALAKKHNKFETAKRKERKLVNWMHWLERTLLRRNIIVDTNTCAYGNQHLVSKNIKKIGNATVFYSEACDGCDIGKAVIAEHRKNKKTTTLPGLPFCAFLLSPLITNKSVKAGDIVRLPKLEK